MKLRPLIAAMLLAGLAACQTVPAERKNNCVCVWEPLGPSMTQHGKGALA